MVILNGKHEAVSVLVVSLEHIAFYPTHEPLAHPLHQHPKAKICWL